MKRIISDIDRLNHIIDAIHSIEYFVRDKSLEEFEADEILNSAVLHKFMIIGESVVGLSSEFREKYKHIEWYKPRSFRNFIAHVYFDVKLSKVWLVIKKDLPIFYKQVKEILSEYS